MSRTTKTVKQVLTTALKREKPLEKIIPPKCDRILCSCVERIETNQSDMLHELYCSLWEACYKPSYKYPRSEKTDGKIEWTTLKE